MMAIKELARRFDIPAIVTAQLNRSADWVEAGERVTPRLSMIKGSGAIEDISAQVLLLSEKRVHPDYTEIEGILDKNRHGEKGLIHFGLKKNPWRVCEL
jgi:replicative DNA helicase